jgi:hypothetical protein
MLIGRLYRKIPTNRLLIAGTESKYGDQVLEEPPIIRNPYNLPMFDSSLYLAILYLEEVTTLSKIQSEAKRITERQLLVSVEDFDHLMTRRKQVENAGGREERKKKRINKEVVQAVEKEVRRANSVSRISKPKSPMAAMKAKKPMSPKSNRK